MEKKNESVAVIYHKEDLDGVLSAAIVKDYYDYVGKTVRLIPFNYGFPIPEIKENIVYVVDMSFDDKTESVINEWIRHNIDVFWIDHHKSSIGDKGEVLPYVAGFREIGTAAMELTWKFMRGNNRTIPSVLEYLSAYDVWDHDRFDWDKVMAVQARALEIVELDVDKGIKFIYDYSSEQKVDELAEEGKRVLETQKSLYKQWCKTFSFEADFKGYKAICLNSPVFRSMVFDDVPGIENYDLMIPFCTRPDGVVQFSLYSTKDIDCSQLALSMGGGGHKNAAGFTVSDPDVITEFIKNRRMK